jgi:hypothetical protein
MFVKAETEKQADEKYKYFSKDLENVEKKITGYIDLKLSETKGEINLKIAEVKADMIKWMFVFVFTSTLATIGSIIAIIKFIK